LEFPERLRGRLRFGLMGFQAINLDLIRRAHGTLRMDARGRVSRMSANRAAGAGRGTVERWWSVVRHATVPLTRTGFHRGARRRRGGAAYVDGPASL
jgi:hypothetical protein